ncbi:hypothetical protein NEOLEDRAFT_1177263 [Neolentinus lepideus HHB14362 ss-1]|uniref:GRF-type domain-containing protein n=1 Tax=Neolentinus lepideus HHB14362 ss-1 TaxID=1314782 RepID=A0A165THC5_9AGAM|nr:hypothetical protein NEOLEDRAFT_1177263 [Neolentinus lepideus HHB14362 ss-1]
MSQGLQNGRIHDVSPVRPDGTVVCYCNVPAAKRTSRTPANPNRDFYSCTKFSSDPNKCKFWLWADNPIIANHPARRQPTTPSQSQPDSQFSSPAIPYASPASQHAPMPPATPTRTRVANVNPPRTPSTPRGRESRLKDIQTALEVAAPTPPPSSASPPPAPPSSSKKPDSEDEIAAEDEPERASAAIQTDHASESFPSPPRSQNDHIEPDDHHIEVDAPSPHRHPRTPSQNQNRSRNPSPAKRARIGEVRYPSLSSFAPRLPGDYDCVSVFAPTSTTTSTNPFVKLLAAASTNPFASVSRNPFLSASTSNNLPASSQPSPTGKGKGKARARVEEDDDDEVVVEGMSESSSQLPAPVEHPESSTPRSGKEKGKGKGRARVEDDDEMQVEAEVEGTSGYSCNASSSQSCTTGVVEQPRSGKEKGNGKARARVEGDDEMQVEAEVEGTSGYMPGAYVHEDDGSTREVESVLHTVPPTATPTPLCARAAAEGLQYASAYLERLERLRRAAELSAAAKARRIQELDRWLDELHDDIEALLKRNEELDAKVEELSRCR